MNEHPASITRIRAPPGLSNPGQAYQCTTGLVHLAQTARINALPCTDHGDVYRISGFLET